MMPLQRVLVIVPFIKILETMSEGSYLQSCPWIDALNSLEKYVEMTRISVITIAYSMLLAILYLLSKGWGVTTF
jgi:hypothetical protein